MRRAVHGSRLLALGTLLGPQAVGAQVGVGAAVVTDSYAFNPGLAFENLREVSIPVLVRMGVADRGELLLSTGWASLSSTGADGSADLSLSGILDTEARFTWEVVPGRMSVVASAVLPSGTEALEAEQVPLLALLANEALDLSTVRFGSGGGFGGGAVGALPVGRMALGLAATFRHEFAYGPVASSPDELNPGLEARFRVGLEGPVGGSGYLRLAGVLSRRGQDEFAGEAQGAAGNLWTGYGAYERSLTSSNLVLYLLGRLRSDPRLEGTALGPALLPRSSLLAFGGRWAVSVRRSDLLTAKVEYRRARAAPVPESETLEPLGTSLRAGFEYRLAASRNAAVVFQAEGLIGEAGDLVVDELIGMTGFRLGLHLEWNP